jgi:hypothetical protein
MHFQIVPLAGRIPNNVLVYRPEEYSFDLEPAPCRGFTSILIDDLSLEIDDAGRVISVWGLCPHTRWTQATLAPPQADFGEIFFVPDAPLLPGVSIRLNLDRQLPVAFDRISGWLRIHGKGVPRKAIRPLPNVILEVDDQGQFCSIWLRPRIADQLALQGSKKIALGSTTPQIPTRQHH